ncbi:MAG: hypothetical protein WBW41_10635 [Verrucomicrobiia bacterium]
MKSRWLVQFDLSWLVLIRPVTRKISSGAISDVFPEYYTNAADADELSDKIANHRNNKDIADDSLANLEAYTKDAAKVAEFCRKTISRVPLMKAWDKKERRKVFFKDILLVILIGVVTGIIGSYALVYFERSMINQSGEKPNAAQPTNAISFPTNK